MLQTHNQQSKCGAFAPAFTFFGKFMGGNKAHVSGAAIEVVSVASRGFATDVRPFTNTPAFVTAL
jgi:hypothetical protein